MQNNWKHSMTILLAGLIFASILPHNVFAASADAQPLEQPALQDADNIVQEVATPHSQYFNTSAVFTTAGIHALQLLIARRVGSFAAKCILNMLGKNATKINMTSMKQIIFEDVAFGCSIIDGVMQWISTVLVMQAGVETDKSIPLSKIHAKAMVYGLPLSICSGIATFVATTLFELYEANKDY